MHFAVAAGSDVGRVRKGNEDSFFADANEFRGLFMVADGMGGHAAGEVASQMAVQTISVDLEKLNDLESAGALETVALALRHANRAVFERSSAERDKMGMGSTASVLVLADERFIIGHLGDSRIYLYRDGELRQITHDHSVVQEQIDAGLITPDAARHHKQSNVITRCVGMGWDVEPDVIDGEVLQGDVFLLASDGLTGMVEDRRLKQLLASRATPDRMVDAMISEANARGGVDNITVVVVRVHSSSAMATGTHPTSGPGAGTIG
ncbi:MAG: Stp1/IreP family PP2C-type Ser/Thr phosphatase [Gemmatimonadota bacterium]|nr:Stp1/IreP family PP2C-type Ser/Thr phosphatase [Gemmatimonadota bacterium]